jgi:hypothetical protein
MRMQLDTKVLVSITKYEANIVPGDHSMYPSAWRLNIPYINDKQPNLDRFETISPFE